MIVDHYSHIDSGPVASRKTALDSADLLQQELPESGDTDSSALLEKLGDLLRTGNAHPDHPRFLAFVPSPSNYISVLAAALAAGFVVPSGPRAAPVGNAIETTTLNWLIEMLDLPATTGGLFVSGGSEANLTALTVARDCTVGRVVESGCAYFSDQTHFSVNRALRVLGTKPGQIRCLPSNGSQRLDPEILARRIGQDRRAGLHPFVVIANAGTTSTGAVDPLAELAEVCRAEQAWLHVDGAYGAAAAVTSRGRQALSGLNLADSLTVDPHKWLFQPPELGCVLLREPCKLEEVFGIRIPSYLAEEVPSTVQGTDYMHRGIKQTREFRALKLWLSLKVFGADAFRSAVAAGMQMAEDVGRFIDRRPGLEVVTPPELAVLTFRCTTAGSSSRQPLVAGRIVDQVCTELRDDGFALVAPTTVDQQRVFRLCTINPRISRIELEATILKLQELWCYHTKIRATGPEIQ
ncbi:pyridoxal phosphate-dependent decarboxylase family protein [Nocardia mangyaensis]|uniref:pyridoxal phosphate-dependent decarboxylase family protein n=1 Tax=Nocardia mangyaensis TaxID=2213200 RepID=UPI003B8369F7